MKVCAWDRQTTAACRIVMVASLYCTNSQHRHGAAVNRVRLLDNMSNGAIASSLRNNSDRNPQHDRNMTAHTVLCAHTCATQRRKEQTHTNRQTNTHVCPHLRNNRDKNPQPGVCVCAQHMRTAKDLIQAHAIAPCTSHLRAAQCTQISNRTARTATGPPQTQPASGHLGKAGTPHQS
jgi:hypothetical protein